MTARASESNAPLWKKDKKRIAEIAALARKYIAEGMPPEEAEARAHQEARESPHPR